jgi:hypothetical protein
VASTPCELGDLVAAGKFRVVRSHLRFSFKATTQTWRHEARFGWDDRADFDTLRIMMMNVIAIPSDVAAAVRSSASDAQGNALEPEVQKDGGNPCRHCLRRARAGERLTLFSHSPFDRQNPYKESGPIFVHSDGCERYASRHELPSDFLDRPIVLRAYDCDQRIARVAVVVDGATEQRAEQLLSDPTIAYLHARSFTHGCYLFRIERAEDVE